MRTLQDAQCFQVCRVLFAISTLLDNPPLSPVAAETHVTQSSPQHPPASLWLCSLCIWVSRDLWRREMLKSLSSGTWLSHWACHFQCNCAAMEAETQLGVRNNFVTVQFLTTHNHKSPSGWMGGNWWQLDKVRTLNCGLIWLYERHINQNIIVFSQTFCCWDRNHKVVPLVTYSNLQCLLLQQQQLPRLLSG